MEVLNIDSLLVLFNSCVKCFFLTIYLFLDFGNNFINKCDRLQSPLAFLITLEYKVFNVNIK